MGNNTIEINGKRYDALNGAFLGNAGQQSSATGVTRRAHQGRNIDGFMPGSKKVVHATANSKAPAVQIAAPGVVKNTNKSASARQKNSISSHQPQRPKTLMRHIVHKPEISTKPVVKAHAPAEMQAAPLAEIAPKLSVSKVDPSRAHRAKTTTQSQRIQRFTKPVQASTAARSVRPAQQPDGSVQRITRTDIARGNIQARRADVIASIPVHQPPQHHQPGKTSEKQAQAPDIFEAALANARSHERPAVKHKKRSRKFMNVISITAAFVILGGFIAYMNLPNIEVHVASIQAGFNAQLPSYKPAGYAMNGSVQNQNGVVSVAFSSGDSGFKVKQQASNWDSQTLYDNVVASSGTSHKTFQSQGRTIYIYGNNAAWVNAGVLYNITTTGNLTPNEMVSIATSI